MTIYLYLKECTHCGLQYFGRTTKSDPIKYTGSGKKWLYHIKKYGKEYITTLWVKSFTNQEDCTRFALQYSLDHNIVESKQFANLCLEDGMHSGAKGLSEQSRQKLVEAGKRSKGKIVSIETRQKMSTSRKGISYSRETLDKMSQVQRGKTHSEETKRKMSESQNGFLNHFYGKTHSEETKRKMSEAAKRRYKKL